MKNSCQSNRPNQDIILQNYDNSIKKKLSIVTDFDGSSKKKKNKNFWGKTTSPLKKDHNIGGNKVNNNDMYQVAKWSDAYF